MPDFDTRRLTYRGQSHVYLIDANSLAVVIAFLQGAVTAADMHAVFGWADPVEEPERAERDRSAALTQMIGRGVALAAGWKATPEPERRTVAAELSAAITADLRQQSSTAAAYRKPAQPAPGANVRPLPSRISGAAVRRR